MTAPPVLIISGYGLNCEAESCLAWKRAGAAPHIMHLNDLLAAPERLGDFAALMFIGGFSFGDHMGSGHVFAQKVKHRLRAPLEHFIRDGRLVLGVCNGFQVMAKIGLVPGWDGELFTQRFAVMQNECGRFQDRWVTLRCEPDSPCIFTRGLDCIDMPVRHGEGRVFTPDRAVIERIEREHLVPCRYCDPLSGARAHRFPENPNGSLHAIAGVCDPGGRVFGLMPHPEAYLFPENHPHWQQQLRAGTLPEEGAGMALFRNAVRFLREEQRAGKP